MLIRSQNKEVLATLELLFDIEVSGGVIRDGIGAFVVPGQIETPVEFRLPVTTWTPLPDARRDRK